VRAVSLLLWGVGLGALAWCCGFALAVARTRNRIGPRLLAAVDVAIGSGLVVFGTLLGYRTLREGDG
jgi:hypothetical protein